MIWVWCVREQFSDQSQLRCLNKFQRLLFIRKGGHCNAGSKQNQYNLLHDLKYYYSISGPKSFGLTSVSSLMTLPDSSRILTVTGEVAVFA